MSEEKRKLVFNSHWYTKEKYVWDRKNHTCQTVYSPDRFLFAQGQYSTKIKESDLPSYFVPCYIRRHWGWIDTKRIRDMAYRPNFHTNHVFKDDFLLISYTEGQKIKPNAGALLGFVGYDDHIWGFSIVNVVQGAKKNAGYDTSRIERAIMDKLKWLREAYPDEYELESGDKIYQLFAGDSPMV